MANFTKLTHIYYGIYVKPPSIFTINFPNECQFDVVFGHINEQAFTL